MIFTAIEVENIFAYHDESRIDLSGCSPERNIILIRGRNGAGKTSLLNAIKLLFLGSKDDNLRRVGFGGTPISKNHYVLGQPGRWYGVFHNESSASNRPARVALEWTDGGQSFKAQRIFRRAGREFTESLTVTRNGVALDGIDSETIISQMLPRELVPFFFFDGEQIQSIADAEIGREQVEIERLLGLSFLVHLINETDSYSKQKKQAGLPDLVRAKIVKAENDHRAAMFDAEAADRERIALEEEVLALDRQKQSLDGERNRLRTGISETDRRRMSGRIAVLDSQIETLALEIAEEVPTDAIWFANLDLVRRAFRTIDTQLASSADGQLADYLHRQFPGVLVDTLGELDPPVALSEDQRRALVLRVKEMLQQAGVDPDFARDPILASLPPRQTKALRDKFLAWSEQGEALAARHVDMLSEMRKLSSERLQAQRDLDDAELTTDEARRHFEALSTRLTATEIELREKSTQITEKRLSQQGKLRRASELAEIIRHEEAQFAEVTRLNTAYQYGIRVKRALEDFRDKRRRQIRIAVEAHLNERVAILLAPSELIKSVRLDDQFVMTYFDTQHNEVARHSISAGMRQLLAMSMLWALKDRADRPLPIVIDTPLGRIDKQNRALLMTEYFPKAGNPLVLLPTNSEISDEEYAQIADKVCRCYEIRNEGGHDARIAEVPSNGPGFR
ncbi:DNA sulfur modification protein DndD [Bosea sp. BE125]|uniref:AAA family ATPase n=1 Tax=Bosea sp. BE125 TaxID=2817909 RepID=UPI00285C8E8A|nr:AAA family ATPase [Bosea sp. BE125]MDR6875004.1 DNA sulfur modification protein DndD [Bosea sp. BE125]